MQRGRRVPGAERTLALLVMAVLQHLQTLNFIPIVTLAVLAGLVFLHLSLSQATILSLAISAKTMLRLRALSEPWLLIGLGSQLVHLDDLHIYYNSLSFLHKGSQLEAPHSRGSLGLAVLLLQLLVLTPAFYVALACAGAAALPALGLYAARAVGFSGVIFGLKAVLQATEEGHAFVGGMRVPAKLAAWGELVLIQLATPNASFLGHLAGILAGLTVVWAEQKWAARRRR